ncbi:hypothetical protein GCM10010246_25510 [Streptomyces cuspidosporus]|uniref:Transposase n=1 Tax=Streptomyces cuspidosporus TaxID=66882 RepID=A0ABN3FX87_9ACTN
MHWARSALTSRISVKDRDRASGGARRIPPQDDSRCLVDELHRQLIRIGLDAFAKGYG